MNVPRQIREAETAICAQCGEPIDGPAYIQVIDGRIVVMHTHCAGV